MCTWTMNKIGKEEDETDLFLSECNLSSVLFPPCTMSLTGPSSCCTHIAHIIGMGVLEQKEMKQGMKMT